MLKFTKYIVAWLCLFASLANAAENKPELPTAQANASITNPITQSFVNQGVLDCAARINQVIGFVSGDSVGTGAFLFMPNANQNTQMISASMEVLSAKQKPFYASASFAPNQTSGCGALYEAVSWWPDKCDVVAKQQFGGQKINAKLKQDIAILDLGPTSRIFLMPTNDGCVSIKKELVY